MTRGRLIQKFLVVIRRLDPTATGAVVGGGYDDTFGEPEIVDDGTQLGSSSRREEDALILPCQLDRNPSLGIDTMTRGGHVTQSTLAIILHMPDLENGGHLKPNGEPNIHAGDRIEKILDLNGNLVIAFDKPSGMFVKNGELGGYGLAAFTTPKVNLFVLTCMPEEKGAVV